MLFVAQSEHCEKECGERVKEPSNCCMQVCLYGATGILLYSTDPNILPAVNLKALEDSFLLSVEPELVESWRPVVRTSLNRCYDDMFGVHNKQRCDVIPSSLFSVIACTAIENILKCPNYNPYNLESCEYEYEFYERCMLPAFDYFEY